MKLNKKITFIFLLIAISLISTFTQVKAATGSKYLNLKMLRNSGYGYKLGDTGKNVWKIYETGTSAEDTIYCLKGGPGFGSSDYMTGSPVETHYTNYFNLKEPDSIPELYKNALPDTNSNDYKAILWILDNCYVAPKQNDSDNIKSLAATDRKELLKNAAEYAISKGNPEISNIEYMDVLTDDDIDAVQQLAVWYYTNPTGDYHVEALDFYVNIVKGTDGSYKSLSEDVLENGWERAYACQALLDYFVQTPKTSGFTYEIRNLSNPLKISNNTKKFEIVGDRYVVGPYKIEQIENIKYSFEANFTDENDNPFTDIVLLDQNKQQVATGTTIKDLLGEEFYISIPTTITSNSVKLSISGSYTTTKTTYWSVSNPSSVDQPVVIVEKEYKPFSESVSIDKPQEQPKFDLALRKFITSINGVAPTEDRTPKINIEEIRALANKQITTTEKVHPKYALTVKPGDKVVYKIRVYNEGETDGYATQVVDYLPEGLKLAENSTINTTYGWAKSSDEKTIVTSYLADKLINKFDGTTLDYKDIEIECEVIATVTTQNQELKNIAEIREHKDNLGSATVTDLDSTPDNVNINNYAETNQEDDDDFENLLVLGQHFDLSLRKFITTVKSGTKTTNYNRTPQVIVTDLKSGAATTATYNHDKTPVSVSNGDIVTYTIRVYNEGRLDGYVTEITDHLPKQLQFIVDDEVNAKYGWTVSTDGRTVKTDITSINTANTASRDAIYENRTSANDKVLLKAFDGEELDYIDVQIRCKVKENINLYERITNIAEITGFADAQGNEIVDRDSQKSNVTLPTDETLPKYKDTEIESGAKYIKGQQDDDDFEKLILKRFDLALRKFITGVNDKEITNRAPVFTVVSENEYTYVHTKEPLEVANANIIIYTLRIFNEGNMSGYAEEVKDNIPEGLEFLPEHSINTTYKWKMYKADGTEAEELEEASYIKTDYLSKDNEVNNNNLIKPFNPDIMTMPDYKDIKVAFKVIEPNTSDKIIINTAEIAEDADENGNEIDDVDSTPNNNISEEDDQDIEKIKVKYFDLALKKWVTESIVTYNGKTTITKTGHTGDEDPEPPAKVEIRSDRINDTEVKFKFNIKVTNEGEIEGYVKELIDYIPEGLEFKQEDNPEWRVTDDGKVLTDQLKDVLIKPGESQKVEIILTWINGKDNMGLKTNWAEIYEDYNEYESPDIDSTPGNNEPEEDDIDKAPVIITTATGSMPTYVTLALLSVVILASGIVLIKKYVI